MSRLIFYVCIGMIAGSLLFGNAPSACAGFDWVPWFQSEKEYREFLRDPAKVKKKHDELVEEGKFKEARELLWESQRFIGGGHEDMLLRMADVETSSDGEQKEQWREFHIRDAEILSDYNTTQRIRRSGDHALTFSAGASGVEPTATMSLVRDGKRVGKRSLSITYDTAGDGTVEYVYTLKPSARIGAFLKKARAVSIRLKGDPAFVTIAVEAQGKRFSYEYTGMYSEVWQDVPVPLASFTGFQPDAARDVTAVILTVEGAKLERPAGVLWVDDLMLVDVPDDVLRDLARACENDRYKDPAAFIGEYYGKREKY